VLLALDLELALSDAGCEIVGSAMDRVGAIALAERDRPDLALVDVNLLDGQTGPLIAQELVETQGTAVIFLTANPEQIPEGFAGALGAVSKPFDEETIRAAVGFAARLVRGQDGGDPPRRFRPAPWLTASLDKDP